MLDSEKGGKQQQQQRQRQQQQQQKGTGNTLKQKHLAMPRQAARWIVIYKKKKEKSLTGGFENKWIRIIVVP